MSLESKISIHWKSSQKKDNILGMGECPNSYAKKKSDAKDNVFWDFPGGPAVRTLRFCLQGLGLIPEVGELKDHVRPPPKKEKKEKKKISRKKKAKQKERG